jgi:hypothetical protein
MAMTETNNTDFAFTAVLGKVADALRSSTLCSLKISTGTRKSETPESR